jgi:hypothetical protein
MTKIASGSISQRHGSADPDPDPHQNVIDPEYRYFPLLIRTFLGLTDPSPLVRHTDRGSGSVYQQAKIVRKPLIPIVL